MSVAGEVVCAHECFFRYTVSARCHAPSRRMVSPLRWVLVMVWQARAANLGFTQARRKRDAGRQRCRQAQAGIFAESVANRPGAMSVDADAVLGQVRAAISGVMLTSRP